MGNEFEIESELSDESLNAIHSYALMAGSAYAFKTLVPENEEIREQLFLEEKEEGYNFLKQISLAVNPNREQKSYSGYIMIVDLRIENRSHYEVFINKFSVLESVKNAIFNIIKGPENLKEKNSWLITSIIFGYSSTYSLAEDFKNSFKEIEKKIKASNGQKEEEELILFSDLEKIFNENVPMFSSIIRDYLNEIPKTSDIVHIIKYIDVGKFFTGVPPPDTTLMKDCEIQSYRISGQITPKYFSGSAADLLIFNPNLRECQQIVSGEETGFSFYPCAKESIRPRELIFNQLIFDGPYTSGGPETAALGIPILREVENETYTQDRKLQKIQHMGIGKAGPESYIASYKNGWIFDEFTGQRFLSFIGDVNTLSTVDILKKFEVLGANGFLLNRPTGNFHFLGKRQFITGQDYIVQKAFHLGDVKKIGSGFSPIVFRLNKKENDEIYSGLEINLFDKVKNSGILMTYSLSPDSGILSSHRPGEVKLPSLNIENNRPNLPFMGISADFSSKNFNINPSVKFNFGTTTSQTLPRGDVEYGIEASDFSFTGFNFTGKIFPLSSGKIKYTTEISSAKIKPVSPAFTTLFHTAIDANGNNVTHPTISDSKFLLQRALGFPLTGDCLPKSDTGVFYGIDYSYYRIGREDVPYAVPFWVFPRDPFAPYRVVVYPPTIKVFAQQSIIGDPSILRYIGDHTKKISRKQVFGPLDEPSDSNLGVGFNQRMTSIENPADKDYKYVRNLNPARYYSGLFASNRKVFLYPAAEKVYNSGSIFNAAKKSFPNKISVTYEVEERYFKNVTDFGRFNTSVTQGLDSLKNEIWVDQDFSHPNAYRPNSPYPPSPIWTFKPGNPGVNLNGIFYTGLDFPLEIEMGSIRNIRSELFFNVQQDSYGDINHTITPLFSGNKQDVEKKVKYEITVDYTYTPPIKSLSDWQNYPIHAHRAFVSTGDTLINLSDFPPQDLLSGDLSGKWSEALNKAMNNYYGQDPLFLADLDAASTEEPKGNANENVLNQNLSGDAWNGFYIKSGAVVFPSLHQPYRVPSADCRLFFFHNNLKENRIFIRNADIFPSFPADVQFSGKNLADFCFPGEKFTRQNKNLANPSTGPSLGHGNNSCFEISGLSLFSGGLEKEISYKIQRTGTLYRIPTGEFNKGIFLPKITPTERGEYIDKYYPELKGFTFYSGVEDFSKSIGGYYLDYEEGSEIKINKKSFKIYSGIFPQFDEVFQFENSGKLAFSGEFSYNSQEESCIISHGVQVNEKGNEKDKFQEMGYKFSYISPVLVNRIDLQTLGYGVLNFPTRQIARRNKIITGNDRFINKNMGYPNYHNHFYMGVLPEFCYFSSDRSIIGTPTQDTLYYPKSEIISSSSYDYKEQYEDGSFYEMKTVDKEYEVVKSMRLYDSTFCDAVFNSGTGFIEILPTGDSLNSNSECKQFWAPNGTSISDLELEEGALNFISKTKDRSSDISDIKSTGQP